MADELNEKLLSTMRQVFDDPELILTDTMTAADVDGWDSLNNVKLMIALQKAFGIKLAMAEIASLSEPGQNIGTLKSLLARKLGLKS
jgi:acyl carrier protein